MAVREFDGTDDRIDLAIGGCSHTGAVTLAALCKLSGGAGTWRTIDCHAASGTPALVFGVTDTNVLYLSNGTVDTHNGAFGTADGWAIVVARRAAGTGIAGTLSKFPLGTATWTHTTGTAGSNNASAQNLIRVGHFNVDEFFPGQVALIGEWGSQLNQAEVEALATNLRTSDWIDHSITPTAVVAFNQASVATPVEDLIGTSDQSAITGTAVVTGDDPPGWTFDGVGEGPAPPDGVYRGVKLEGASMRYG